MNDVLAAGGVVLFGADTVYGLACDPANPEAVRRLYALKGRPPEKPSALMWFDRDAALEGVPPRTRAVLERLLPGPLTAVLERGGLRVPAVGEDNPIAAVTGPVLQSSANPSGGREARRLEDVDPAIRRGADLALDAGELPGTASTVVDLRRWEDTGEWRVLREGALPHETLARALASAG